MLFVTIHTVIIFAVCHIIHCVLNSAYGIINGICCTVNYFACTLCGISASQEGGTDLQTSFGSGLGDSAKNMQSLAISAKVLDGKRFSSSASQDELKKWAEQF